MHLFKIKYIDRDGHREEETVVAKTRRLARLRAESNHDDVLSVKRSPIHWGKLLLYFLIIAGVVAIVHFA